VALAHGFARVEGNVLAHVGEVRRHQREVAHTQAARGAGGQQQFDELVVGLVQAAQQHGALGQAPCAVHGQRELELPIGEAVALDFPRAEAAGRSQGRGGGTFIGKVQQASLRSQ